MQKISPKQRQIYEYIDEFSQQHGYSPSVREIAAHVGLSSPATVHFHLKSLRDAGLISQEEGKTRTLKVVRPEGEKNRVPILRDDAAEEEHASNVRVAEDFLTFDTRGADGEFFAMRMEGDSMRDAGILAGDLVVVHRQEEAAEGDMVAAVLRNRTTVRVLDRRDGCLLLCPRNAKYKPADPDQARILGLVTAVVRQYDRKAR
ncbi:MAG: transcriptional repressor LexA [Oscillospiraceae bacterium]|nr:transcriptional repressor LexA [Oscillospiraceae bacterium]